ncbi:hypothetical protein V565_027160 [Rhizoctonia solani 123E]|uniref:Uncharacterized protein n=1 Tax=Rhizoctonia solani 123E TaxID=1423351 RepID=A0A074S7X0_9AGAM|nr:hypothetical protein V565_027160 [Rhizoctonia solani 123E]
MEFNNCHGQERKDIPSSRVADGDISNPGTTFISSSLTLGNATTPPPNLTGLVTSTNGLFVNLGLSPALGLVLPFSASVMASSIVGTARRASSKDAWNDLPNPASELARWFRRPEGRTGVCLRGDVGLVRTDDGGLALEYARPARLGGVDVGVEALILDCALAGLAPGRELREITGDMVVALAGTAGLGLPPLSDLKSGLHVALGAKSLTVSSAFPAPSCLYCRAPALCALTLRFSFSCSASVRRPSFASSASPNRARKLSASACKRLIRAAPSVWALAVASSSSCTRASKAALAS